MIQKVGFIGLGNIGLPMAKCVVRKGFKVSVCGHVRRQPVEEMKREGAVEMASPFELARASDVVISMVRDQAQTDEVLRGEHGVLRGLGSGATLIIMSTLSPSHCRRVADDCDRIGVGFLDAPVSGGSRGAEAARLSIMVGGEEAVLERCRPLLEAMGNNIFHFGPVGTGQVAKLVNNALALGNIFLATEALALGVGAGIELERLLPMIRVSSGSSQVVQNWDFYARLKREHRPGGPMDMVYKDMKLALELAEELGIDMPMIKTASKLDVGRLVDG